MVSFSSGRSLSSSIFSFSAELHQSDPFIWTCLRFPVPQTHSRKHKDMILCVGSRNYMTVVGFLRHRQQLCSQTQTLQHNVLLHEWKPQLVFCNVFLSQQQPQEVTINNKPVKIKVSVLLFRQCNTVGHTRLTGGSWAVHIYMFDCKK